MKLETVKSLGKDTIGEWSRDSVARLSAALAFYTMMSLAPLVLVVVGIAGLVFGQQAARGEIVRQIQGLVGKQGADVIQQVLSSHAYSPGKNLASMAIGIALLLFSASGVFGELQSSLNAVWNVKPKPRAGIWATIRQRFFSFLMVLGTGFLLLVSLVMSAALAASGRLLGNLLPLAPWFWQIVNFAVSLVVITLVLGLIYKYVPDVQIRWVDVWRGAALSALLFVVGKFLIGLYLGSSTMGSAYGAAGSLVIMLVWIYYSAQIIFLGAEFTQVYVDRFGSGVKPDTHAMPAGPRAQKRQELAERAERGAFPRAEARVEHNRPAAYQAGEPAPGWPHRSASGSTAAGRAASRSIRAGREAAWTRSRPRAGGVHHPGLSLLGVFAIVGAVVVDMLRAPKPEVHPERLAERPRRAA